MMFKTIIFILFGLWLFQDYEKTINPEFSSRLDSIYRHVTPTITVEEFKEIKKHRVYVLDTREEDEYEVSHIKFSRHVGYIWFDMRKVYDIPKSDTIVVYCAVGNRSERIGEKLQKAGYQHVYNLYGGIFEWINRHNPVYKTSGTQTTEIHAYNKSWSIWLENGVKVW